MNQARSHDYTSTPPSAPNAGKKSQTLSNDTHHPTLLQTNRSEKPTYTEKTTRLQAWSQLIKSVTPYIWVAVILIVIIPLIGSGFITRSLSTDSTSSGKPTTEIVTIDRTVPDQDKIDRAIATAITHAHHTAQQFASAQLDGWMDQLMSRVDGNFLDWYFDYFNQKKLEFSAPFVWVSSAVSHWMDTTKPDPNQAVAEKMTEAFQTEFTKRVLRPKIAQLQLEHITRDTVNLYIADLENNISTIQTQYQIPQGEWERYLDDIAVTIRDTEGNLSNLSLKVLVGGSTYIFAKAMIPVVTKIGTKVAVSFAGKASAKMAAKTGGCPRDQRNALSHFDHGLPLRTKEKVYAGAATRVNGSRTALLHAATGAVIRFSTWYVSRGRRLTFLKNSRVP